MIACRHDKTEKMTSKQCHNKLTVDGTSSKGWKYEINDKSE